MVTPVTTTGDLITMITINNNNNKKLLDREVKVHVNSVRRDVKIHT